MTLDITIWDVQHGAATFIRTPAGQSIVIDLGVGDVKASKQFSPLLHLKNSYAVTNLDEVIITHPHRDHLDDVFNFDELQPRALRRPTHLSEAEIWAGNQDADRSIIEKYLEIDRRYNSPIRPEQNPELPENNGGVVVQTFVPSTTAKSNLNNHSLVTFLTYASSTILIPGDNEAASWRELLGDQTFCKLLGRCDVLVAPHHGRQAGYCPELFQVFKPRLTVVSDGPASQTTAVAGYSAQGRGWTVRKRSGGKALRNVVTTRADGVINVRFGLNNDAPFIQVTVD